MLNHQVGQAQDSKSMRLLLGLLLTISCATTWAPKTLDTGSVGELRLLGEYKEGPSGEQRAGGVRTREAIGPSSQQVAIGEQPE